MHILDLKDWTILFVESISTLVIFLSQVIQKMVDFPFLKLIFLVDIPGDYNLTYFDISHDLLWLIPFIQDAMAVRFIF